MALFNIPQFIDTEDKIVGPFTAKQIGWMIAAAAVLFVCYAIFGKTTLLIIAIPALGIFGGLAFYRPYGQPLTFFISSVLHFFFNPKMYIWRRMMESKKSAKKVSQSDLETKIERKIITQEKIREISGLVDAENKKTF
jgi:membrane protein implicated in regulation of membrane protease activity